MEDRMTLSLPTRRSGRRTALAATLALAASGFAFAAADAAEAKPCPPDVCGNPVVFPKPKFPWPKPVCLSCPDRFTLLERHQEIVLPEVSVELLPEVLNPRALEGFEGGGGLGQALEGGGGIGGR
jgi:hypothetical protein